MRMVFHARVARWASIRNSADQFEIILNETTVRSWIKRAMLDLPDRIIAPTCNYLIVTLTAICQIKWLTNNNFTFSLFIKTAHSVGRQCAWFFTRTSPDGRQPIILLLNTLNAAHPRFQHFGDNNRAISLLVGLHYRDQRTGQPQS
jgi:hypothetical protein